MSCLRLVGALVLVVGCSTPALPPLMGFSKFAHSASVDPEIGKLTATTGALIDVANGTNSSGSVSAFHAEGALSVWLAPFYDLTVGAGPWMLGVEGNIMPVHTPTVRFGIIHGIGTSLLASWDNTPGSSGSTTSAGSTSRPSWSRRITRSSNPTTRPHHRAAAHGSMVGSSRRC